MGSSLVGFIASGNVGMAGVENSYNRVLNGVNGREYGYLNADNNFEKTIKEAVDGNHVVLTMDANIQGVVEGDHPSGKRDRYLYVHLYRR